MFVTNHILICLTFYKNMLAITNKIKSSKGKLFDC